MFNRREQLDFRNRLTGQALCFLAGANSIFSSEEKILLTKAAPSQDYDQDAAMLREQGIIRADEETVAIITGNGYKTIEALEEEDLTPTMTVRDVPLHATRTLAAATPAFNMVGLHWRGDGTVSFRARTVSGRWTPSHG